MLDQHPQIVWDGEVLEKHLHQMARRRRHGIDALYGRLGPQQAVAEIMRRKRLLAGDRIYGIEIQDYHLDFFGLDAEALIDALKSMGFTRFVVLDRTDQFRKLVSHMVAQDRKAHHIAAGDRAQQKQISIVPDRVYVGHRFRTVADVLESYRTFLSSVRCILVDDPVLELNYESHIENDPHEAYRQVCAWIGVERAQPRIKFGKTAAQPLADIVANFDEVMNYIERQNPTCVDTHGTALPEA